MIPAGDKYMENEFVRLNIALKPPKFVSEAAIAMSRELRKKFESHFVLDGSQVLPHITIYSPEFPSENLEKILKAVGSAVAGEKKLKLREERFETEEGFIGVKFFLTDEGRRFHERIVAALSPLRGEHLRPKYETAEYAKKTSPEKMENIRKYGYGNVMNLYRPHLTITRIKDESRAEAIIQDLKWPVVEFEAGEVGVFRMGDHGTCREPVKIFELT
jgi:2'-5' RNA ligase